MKTTRFDAARYLDTEERQAAYVSAAPERATPNSFAMRSASSRAPGAFRRLPGRRP